MNTFEQMLNKSSIIHRHVKNKSWNIHLQLKTTYFQLEITIDEQVNNEKVINKSWRSYEQAEVAYV